MDENKKSINKYLIIIVALVVFILLCGLIFFLIKSQNDNSPNKKAELSKIPCAKKEISANSEITQDLIEYIEVNKYPPA